MPAKKKNGKAARRTAVVPRDRGYTISAPNAAFETGPNTPTGHYFGKLRFIDGKARVTDAFARTCTYRDGTSGEDVFFENAEQLVRFFLSQTSSPGREFTVTPELSDLNLDAAKLSPYFNRIPEGDDIRVELKADAPEWVREYVEEHPDRLPDEYNPNLGRSRRERIRRQKSAPLVSSGSAQRQRGRDAAAAEGARA